MIKSIPNNLYINGVIHFSLIFQEIYEANLRNQNVYNDALVFKQDKNLIGGNSREATLDHFAQRFQTSGSRNEYFCLDPDRKFQTERDQVLTSLGNGNIGILDIACGTGGSTLAMLTTLYELRIQNIVPKEPLNVSLLGIDYSHLALKIYKTVLDEASILFKESGIELTIETREWDAMNPVNTTIIMDHFLSDIRARDEYIAMINNFSGAISANNQIKNTIEDILTRLTGKNFTFLWIEPGTNDAKIVLGFFKKMIEKLKNFLNFQREDKSEKKSDMLWYNFIMQKEVKGQISLASFKRQ